MARKYLGMLRLLFLLLPTALLVYAIPWQEAPSTTHAPLVSSTASLAASSEIPVPPLPTPPPQVGNGALEAPNICGYVNHDSLNPYTCASSLTCLWNSPLHLVGCGSPSSIAFHTTCIPYRHASFCNDNSTCLSDASILHCPSEIPHCATARVGPAGNYSIRACQANPAFGKLKVELDYAGQSVLGYLPRWLGEDGSVRYGTVTPELTSSSAGIIPSGSNGGVDPATIPGGVFTIIISTSLPHFGGGGGGNHHCNSTCRVEKYEAQVRKQALAGGLVGGLMVLFGAGFGIWVVWMWRRKVTRRREGEDEGGGFVMQDFPIGTVGGKTERESDEGGVRARTPSLDDT